MADLKQQVAQALAEQDAGEGTWDEFRALQRAYAAEVYMTKSYSSYKGNKYLRLDRSTLRLLNKMDFPEGTVIECGKYRITCRGRKTEAYTARGAIFRPLGVGEMPQYIHSFVC